MEDKFSRDINYARISLTDSCNLKCIYCMPEGYSPKGKKIITENEIKIIVEALAELGIKRIRLTGGEPLLRTDIVDIVRDISEIKGIQDIGITTNGVLLGKYLDKLRQAGLKRINISLDSLKEDVFKKITGGNIADVLKAISDSMEAGLKVKINMVPIKGINDDEIMDFIGLSQKFDIDVRFIELMPIGPGVNYKGVESGLIKQALGKNTTVKIENHGGGPSEVYQLEGCKGRVGFITPMSHNFCDSCNRIRITSDGKLKTCLHNPGEIDLIPYLGDMGMLKNTLYEGILNKYQRHTMDVDKISKSQRKMVGIGG